MKAFPRTLLTITAIAAVLVLSSALAADTVQRIYTAPDSADQGGIKGMCNATITHALAVNHDRLRVYRGEVTADGRSFNFPHLPVGKYDLVMVTKEKVVYEGIVLGETPHPALLPVPMANLQSRVEKQDAFFNHAKIHRFGIDGETCLAFVERLSDRKILRQNAEKLGANLRRFEIMEIAKAGDDWQVSGTRHLYREEQPVEGIDFFQDKFVPEFTNLRVISNVKDIGSVLLPTL